MCVMGCWVRLTSGGLCRWSGATPPVAGHRRGHELEPLADQQRIASRGKVVGDIADQRLDVAARQYRGHRTDQQRARSEPFEREAERGKLRALLLEPVALDLV